MCPPMKAHWRHLANRIEFVHPSAHSCPQPKRQIDRFSRFCTVHGRKCLYFTMGAAIHQNCSFLWGIWIPHLTHDALDPCQPTTQTAPRSVQPIYFTMSPYFTMVRPSLLQNCPFPWRIWTPCNTWFLGPTRVLNLNRNSIVSAVFAGLTSVTDWQTDRPTDRPTDHATQSVTIDYNRPQSPHVRTK